MGYFHLAPLSLSVHILQIGLGWARCSGAVAPRAPERQAGSYLLRHWEKYSSPSQRRGPANKAASKAVVAPSPSLSQQLRRPPPPAPSSILRCVAPACLSQRPPSPLALFCLSRRRPSSLFPLHKLSSKSKPCPVTPVRQQRPRLLFILCWFPPSLSFFLFSRLAHPSSRQSRDPHFSSHLYLSRLLAINTPHSPLSPLEVAHHEGHI